MEWDNGRHTHDTVGGLKVSLLHPRQVIPQAGVNNIQDMDYIFVLTGTTKKEIKRRYNVDVFSEDEEFPEMCIRDSIDILYKRYVQYKSLEEIAVEMSYSYTRLRHLHGRALQGFKKKYIDNK